MELSIHKFEERIRSRKNAEEFFAIMHSLVLLKDSCYNTFYIRQVISGEKLLLKISEAKAPELRRIRNCSMFDKEALFNTVYNNTNMRRYIPDSQDHSRISKESLLCIIYSIDKNEFNRLYQEYVLRKVKASRDKKELIKMKVAPQFINSLNNFNASERAPKKKTFIVLTQRDKRDYENIINSNLNTNNTNLQIRDNRSNTDTNFSQNINNYPNNDNNKLSNLVNNHTTSSGYPNVETRIHEIISNLAENDEEFLKEARKNKEAFPKLLLELQDYVLGNYERLTIDSHDDLQVAETISNIANQFENRS